MQNRNRSLTAQALLCLMAFLAVDVAANAMKPALIQSKAFALAGAQSSQDKPDQQQPNPSQPDQSATKSVVVTGTIVKNGSTFVLRASSGTVYQLDAQEKAQPYEGKSVKVTGDLEAQTSVIHVKAIEAMNA